MTAMPRDWSDLARRMGSGLALVIVGLAGVWFGGAIFHGLVTLVCGLMVWELTRMLVPERRGLAVRVGLFAGAATLLAVSLPHIFALPIIATAVLFGLVQIKRHHRIFGAFAFAVLAAGWGMMHVRDDLGFGWMAWLVLVVVVTDVAGYFAGRTFGGPKFWPAVSPKKTWSGTTAGWVGAAVIGVLFATQSGNAVAVILASVFLSFASQMGDIAESAIKRRMGVKDSSSLIPGHGGVLDRFDGMLGASLGVLVLEGLLGFPWSVL